MAEAFKVLEVVCPTCGKVKNISIPEAVFSQKKFGTVKIQIPINAVCPEHQFIVFVDTKGIIRGYEKIDVLMSRLSPEVECHSRSYCADERQWRTVHISNAVAGRKARYRCSRIRPRGSCACCRRRPTRARWVRRNCQHAAESLSGQAGSRAGDRPGQGGRVWS